MAAFVIFISESCVALYFGMDAFHPGGWPGFFEDYGDMSLRLQNVYCPSFRLVPFGPK